MAQYRAATSDDTPTVFVSTASPYKFCGAVLTAIGETPRGDGVELLDQLHEASGVPVPRRLAALKGKTAALTRRWRSRPWNSLCWNFCSKTLRSP